MFKRSCFPRNKITLNTISKLRTSPGYVVNAPNTPKKKGEKVLGVAGGPSAWMQAFNHLQASENHSVVFFQPRDASALWESSGRHISIREKVTKFINPLPVIKNTHLTGVFTRAMMPRFATMALSFLSDRFTMEPHAKVADDITASVQAYRKLNTFLCEKGGEPKPIWHETGRMVIAGEVEYHNLYRKVLQWRKDKGMVDTDKMESCQQYLTQYGGLLFKEGYKGYPLQLGGYVARDADQTILRGLQKAFGARLTIVDGNITVVTAFNEGGYEAVATERQAGTNRTYAMDQLYLSTGTTHIMKQGQRLAPPVVITGHSGVVSQVLTGEAVEKVLAMSGGCKTIQEFFETHPAAFMTDDFECTYENSEPMPMGGGHRIRWRITGNAHVNTDRCSADPVTTLVIPVRRFLAGSVTIDEEYAGVKGGFRQCPRQVGPTVREEILPFGKDGIIALNWGHMGVTLAGVDIQEKVKK